MSVCVCVCVCVFDQYYSQTNIREETLTYYMHPLYIVLYIHCMYKYVRTYSTDNLLLG